MARYTGSSCPICKKAFTDQDDIVVCPDCGTPYHRACWKTVGVCVHEAEHTAGFNWQPDGAPADAEHDAVCANCGTHNPPGAERCSHCGVPLKGQNAPRPADGGTPIYARDPGAATPGAGAPKIESYAAGPDGGIYRRELGPDDAIDGIKARDWASYVGRSSMYYLMQFFRMSESKRTVSVCFSALVFGPIYLFYRKLWKEGLVTGAIYLALQIPAMLDLISRFNPALLGGMPTGWLGFAITFCDIAVIALRTIIMLYAVYWYKQESSRRIHAIYKNIPEGRERTDALALSGGTSLAAGAICLLLYYLFYIGCFNLAGPEFFRTLLSAYGL